MSARGDGIGSSVMGPLMLKGVSEFVIAYAAIQAELFPTNLLGVCISHETLQSKAVIHLRTIIL